ISQYPRSSPIPGARGAEHVVELVRRRDLELVVPAVGRLLVGTPTLKDSGVTEARSLHVVVLHLADALDAKRLPRQILAGAPAALAAGHACDLSVDLARPLLPGMIVERVLAQRRELYGEIPAHGHRERRGDADVLQMPPLVIESQQQRADRFTLSVLV